MLFEVSSSTCREWEISQRNDEKSLVVFQMDLPVSDHDARDNIAAKVDWLLVSLT